MTAPEGRLSSHRRLSEPELRFHPERPDDIHVHPLKGLATYGPFSRSALNAVMDPIRVGIVAPAGQISAAEGLLRELEAAHAPQERRAYLIDYPGFSRIFGLRIVAASRECCFELPSDTDTVLATASSPHTVLAERIIRLLAASEARRTEFDLLFVYLPARWSEFFFGGKEEDFDLHDFIKAAAASRDIPVQLIRQDKALAYRCRCSVMWRLSIAAYCKAGGVPWKLAAFAPDAAHIGISYVLKRRPDSQVSFVTCCSQVFDADGAGLEFVAFGTTPASVERGNPFLGRNEMRHVMHRSMALYQRRHGGCTPKRITVAKSTEFKDPEIAGCFDAFRGTEQVDLIQVVAEPGWRGVLIEPPRSKDTKKGQPGNYPVERGTFLQLSECAPMDLGQRTVSHGR